ncbi:MAG: bifunctional diguanylate cyclase/phosphodiesterase [Actinomycetota bacterium]|nr:bifunctional diguanylate cyclase/phosphodiesterase [Actinomycetota bacterium]
MERAAEALDADVVALLSGDEVVCAVGYPNDTVPVQELLSARDGTPLGVERLGRLEVLTVPVGEGSDSVLLLARAGNPFTVSDQSLLRGMGRVLSLALRQLGLLDDLRGRQELLEHLSLVQAAMASRVPTQEVLDAITAGAGDLLSADVAALRLLDPADPDFTLCVSHLGLTAQQAARSRRAPVSAGIAGLVARDGLALRVSAYDQLPDPLPGYDGIFGSAMAVPVSEDERVVGALMVTTTDRQRRYSEHDESVLRAFGDQVSLALANARTLDAVHQARHDPLTGFANRGLFIELVDQALVAGAAVGEPNSLLFIDVDRFKAVNDTLGHAVGDAVLSTVAALLRRVGRREDVFGRLGGDEFAVLLPRTTGGDADAIGRRLLATLAAPVRVLGHEVSISASVGRATREGAAAANLSTASTTPTGDLLREADLAMYRAKSRGGNCHEVFSSALLEEVVDRAALRADLEVALATAQLSLALQPVMALRSGRVVAAEALLRWNHPTRGLVPPCEFIPVAEQTGLIGPLGRWVLEHACRHATSWPAGPDGHAVGITVNVSGHQLRDSGFVAEVASALTKTGLDPARLVLEITESVLVDDVPMMLERLSLLKNLGVRLAVDDFGTGYSSLAYLAKFPVDVLKIDRSFIAELTVNSRGAALVDAITHLGRTLGLLVVAEGIETEGELQLSTQARCHMGQGYHLGRPVPAKDFADRFLPPAPIPPPRASWSPPAEMAPSRRG